MDRVLRILALVPACLAAGWSQPATDWQREISSRYLDWSQSNTVLFEAVQRLAPCSPRLSTLLVEVREDAAALAKANRQYFDQYGAARRKDLAESVRLASETETALPELRSLDVDTNRAAELTKELRKGLTQKQTLLQEIASGVEAENKLWTAYYNAVETVIRRQCFESQGGRAKPPARSKRR
jgi:hypothetical protein